MARSRDLAVIAAGFVAGGAAYVRLPESPGRPMIAFLLPAAAAMICVILRSLSMRDPIRGGETAVAATYDAIVFWIVLFMMAVHGVVLSGLLLGGGEWVVRGVTVLLGLALASVGNLLPRTRPNLAIGIRTSRTLTDRRAWMRANRIAGYAAVGLGTVIVASGALLPPGPKVRDVVSIAAVIAAGVLAMCLRRSFRA